MITVETKTGTGKEREEKRGRNGEGKDKRGKTKEGGSSNKLDRNIETYSTLTCKKPVYRQKSDQKSSCSSRVTVNPCLKASGQLSDFPNLIFGMLQEAASRYKIMLFYSWGRSI